MFLLFLVGIWAWEGRPLGRGRGPDGPRPALLVRIISSSPLPLSPCLFLNFTRREYLYFRRLFCLFDFIASARPQCCGRSARGKGRCSLDAVLVLSPCLICIEHQRWATANLRGSLRPGQRQNGKPTRVRLSLCCTSRAGGRGTRGAFLLLLCVCLLYPSGNPHTMLPGASYGLINIPTHWTRFHGLSSRGNDIL